MKPEDAAVEIFRYGTTITSTLPTEPRITINGVELTEPQALAARVALSMFLAELADKGTGSALGGITPLYRERLEEVEAIMLNPMRPTEPDASRCTSVSHVIVPGGCECSARPVESPPTCGDCGWTVHAGPCGPKR